jgi:hypothetical protein
VKPFALMFLLSGKNAPSKLGFVHLDLMLTLVTLPSGIKLRLELPLKLRFSEKSDLPAILSDELTGSLVLIPLAITSFDSTPGLKKYCLSFHFTEIFSWILLKSERPNEIKASSQIIFALSIFHSWNLGEEKLPDKLIREL